MANPTNIAPCSQCGAPSGTDCDMEPGDPHFQHIPRFKAYLYKYSVSYLMCHLCSTCWPEGKEYGDLCWCGGDIRSARRPMTPEEAAEMLDEEEDQ